MEQNNQNEQVAHHGGNQQAGGAVKNQKRGSGRWVFAFLIIVAVVFVILIKNDSEALPVDQKGEVITKTPYEERNTLKKTEVLLNFENTVVEGKPTSNFDRKLAVSGKLNRGLLYLKVSVNGKALTKPDDVYINLTAAVDPSTYEAFGGHLISSKSLETPGGESVTELLYDLEDVPYRERYYEAEEETQFADWLRVLNDYQDHRLVAFLSTLGNGTIHELSIYYSCTEGSDCSVSLK